MRRARFLVSIVLFCYVLSSLSIAMIIVKGAKGGMDTLDAICAIHVLSLYLDNLNCIRTISTCSAYLIRGFPVACSLKCPSLPYILDSAMMCIHLVSYLWNVAQGPWISKGYRQFYGCVHRVPHVRGPLLYLTLSRGGPNETRMILLLGSESGSCLPEQVNSYMFDPGGPHHNPPGGWADL